MVTQKHFSDALCLPDVGTTLSQILNPPLPCRVVLHTIIVLGLSVCVCFPYPGTSRNQTYKQQYQRLQCDTGMKYKKEYFLKTIRSEVIASFAYRDSPLLHSAPLSLLFQLRSILKLFKRLTVGYALPGTGRKPEFSGKA